MKKILIRVSIVLGSLILIAFVGFTYFIGKSVFDGFTNVETRQKTNEHISIYKDEYLDFESRYQVKNLSIKSSKYNHDIPAIYAKDENNKNIAVLVHGLGGTKKSLSSIATVLLELGYNCIIYDQRNSGDNMADYNTFGVLESYDCEDVLNYIRKNKEPESKLLLFGESAGGATALIASSRNQDMDYLVLDCPVSDAYVFADRQFEEIEKKEGLPKSFMKFAGNIFYSIKLGFTLDKMNSADYIREMEFKIPVLIINSKADKVTPYEMGEEIFNALNTNEKILHTEEDYGHVEFAKENPEKYKQVISNFLNIEK